MSDVSKRTEELGRRMDDAIIDYHVSVQRDVQANGGDPVDIDEVIAAHFLEKRAARLQVGVLLERLAERRAAGEQI